MILPVTCICIPYIVLRRLETLARFAPVALPCVFVFRRRSSWSALGAISQQCVQTGVKRVKTRPMLQCASVCVRRSSRS